jgi:hypothetical protein
MGRGPLSRLPPRHIERTSSAREVRRAARERHMQASYLLYRHPSRTARCGGAASRFWRSPCGRPVGRRIAAYRQRVNRTRAGTTLLQSVRLNPDAAVRKPPRWRPARPTTAWPLRTGGGQQNAEPIICGAAHTFLPLLKRLEPKSHRNQEWRGCSISSAPQSSCPIGWPERFARFASQPITSRGSQHAVGYFQPTSKSGRCHQPGQPTCRNRRKRSRI